MEIFGSTGVWFLIGAILVWFMQAGFAMVETGFTRALPWWKRASRAQSTRATSS